MKTHEKLADALEPDVSNVRLNRQWIAIREGTEKAAARSRLPWWGLALVAAALLAVLVGILASQQRATQSVDEAPAVATDQSSNVELADGSTVSPLGDATFSVAVEEEKRVAVALNDGKARFAVTRNEEREFEVRAGDVRVVVVGTRFLVANEPEQGGRISVTVEEGVVDVYVEGREGAVARLTAGSRWTTTSPERERMTAVPDILGSGGKKAVDASRAMLGQAVRTPITLPEEPGQAETRERVPSQAHAQQPDAAALFEKGRAARRAGNYRQAVEHFSALLEHYPDNSRAGLAAFQLGRLQADKLGNHRAAVKAFESAIKAQGNSAYKEDAMARRAKSYYKLGNKTRCETSRQAYLSVYPSGVHASRLPDCSAL